jgi:hypothetical protein
VLCADGPVRNLASLSLAPEHRRGRSVIVWAPATASHKWQRRLPFEMNAYHQERLQPEASSSFAAGHDRPHPLEPANADATTG